MEKSITCTIKCNQRIAARLCIPETRIVSDMQLETPYTKVMTDDDDDDDNNNNNNNNNNKAQHLI